MFFYCIEQDIPFAMRIVIQSLLEGSPPSLASRADELNIAIKAKFSNSPDLFNPIEPCPACGAQISLNNLLNAECPRGHVWGKFCHPSLAQNSSKICAQPDAR